MFSFFKRTKSKTSDPVKKGKDKTLTKSVSLPPTLTPSALQDAGKNNSKPPVNEHVTQDVPSVETLPNDVQQRNASSCAIIREIDPNIRSLTNDLSTRSVVEEMAPIHVSGQIINNNNNCSVASQQTTPSMAQVLSYANVLKKLDPVPEVKETKTHHHHSVKPCSHATVAATPRAIVYGTKKENICTPPGSPTLQLKKKLNTSGATTNGVAANPSGKEKRAGDVCVTGAVNGKDVFSKQNDKDYKEDAVEFKTRNSSEEDVFYDADLDKKNLINQEAKFQSQINELTKQLLSRDAEVHKLRFQMEDMERDSSSKKEEIERLQTELDSANKKSEIVHQKLRDLEEEIASLKKKTQEMADELLRKANDYTELETENSMKITELHDTIRELQTQITSLEVQVDNVKKEKDKIEEQKIALETEREEERTIVQDALEEAMGEKDLIEKRWEQDFEKLRTVNTDREQHLLDDFEWKLREIEKTCKRRLEEKDKKTEEKLVVIQSEAEAKLKEAKEMLTEVIHLKSYEAEVIQLRGLTEEQLRSLKYLTKQAEQFKLNEQTFKEESSRLRTLVEMEKENLAHMQNMHSQELVEKERKIQIRMEQQKSEVAMFWEGRLRKECCRLKSELDQLHNEEKHLAVESIKIQKEQEFMNAKQNWDRRIQECLKEISTLKDSLTEKDEYYHSEIESTQTHTDQELLELRRLMDKIDMTHHERFEKLVDEHDEELERINEETESRIREIETNAQLQISSMRATVELVKEQMERESENKIESMIKMHREELDDQWANLLFQKSESVRLLENDYSQRLNHMEEEMERNEKLQEIRETNLLTKIDELKGEVDEKEERIKDLLCNVDTLEGGVQVLNSEIINNGQELNKVKTEADKQIRELRKALQNQQQLSTSSSSTNATAAAAVGRITKEEHDAAILDVNKQNQAIIDQLQRKCQCLTKLFEEIRSRYDKRESRPEDLNIIADLRQIISEQEKDLVCLNEEKRYFQMELMKLQKSQNSFDNYDDDEKEDNEEYDDAQNNIEYFRRNETEENDVSNNQNNPKTASAHPTDRISLNSLISIPATIPE